MNEDQFTITQLIDRIKDYPKSVIVEKYDIVLRDKSGFVYTMWKKEDGVSPSKRVEK